MNPSTPRTGMAAPALVLCALAAGTAAAQTDGIYGVDRTVRDAPLAPGPQRVDEGRLGVQPDDPQPDLGSEISPDALVHVPVTHLYPGAIRPTIEIAVPDLTDDGRIWRGKQYYNQFNCIGCHAPHGGGGMGPSLSNTTFKYGGKPENIYLSILQGRPLGMPVWGAVLPDHVIWDLVAYVRSMAKDDGSWGLTVSLTSPAIEQVPAGYIDTIRPWEHTTPFSYGQPPFAKVDQPESVGQPKEKTGALPVLERAPEE